jgi:hypothetical protein
MEGFESMEGSENMEEFDLPMLDRKTLLREAFAPMITRQRSGILVVSQYHEPQLVTFGAVDKALGLGHQFLEEVESEPVISLLGHEPAKAVNILNLRGAKYGVLLHSGATARVLSISERLAGIYLSPPPGSVCRNPADPHFYPPNQRDLSRPHDCILCTFYLP